MHIYPTFVERMLSNCVVPINKQRYSEHSINCMKPFHQKRFLCRTLVTNVLKTFMVPMVTE